MEYLSSIADELPSMIAGMGFALGLAFIWWTVCRFVLLRESQANWQSRILAADLSERLSLQLHGSPVDRLFLGGLAGAGVVLVCYLLVHWPSSI